jgi:hypothetical protein
MCWYIGFYKNIRENSLNNELGRRTFKTPLEMVW